jgi:hypothetical protein
MPEYPPMPKKVARTIKAKAHMNRLTEIKIFGNRDPRGPDNNIFIWVDKNDRLHIRVLKPQRCYQYSHGINQDGYIEIVQV